MAMSKNYVNQAEFITSAAQAKGWPPAGPPEVAFVGRSNVGKSSLINRLVNRKKLVKTSSRPGCTQLINFFSFNSDAFRFIDLPGYGFARVPLAIKATWGKMIETYLSQRESLRGVVVILDARRSLSQDDSALLDWLKAQDISMIVVITKADKLSGNQLSKNLKNLKQELAPYTDAPLLFSAISGRGVAELWQALENWLAAPAPN